MPRLVWFLTACLTAMRCTWTCRFAQWRNGEAVALAESYGMRGVFELGCRLLNLRALTSETFERLSQDARHQPAHEPFDEDHKESKGPYRGKHDQERVLVPIRPCGAMGAPLDRQKNSSPLCCSPTRLTFCAFMPASAAKSSNSACVIVPPLPSSSATK